MKIRTFRIDQLNPAPYNPRNIGEKELNGLTGSIEKFGYVELVIVNVRAGCNVVVSGHQRLKALGKLGYDSVDCVVVDLSEEDEKALNLTMNNRFIQGDYDSEKLKSIISELSTVDFEVDFGLDALIDEYFNDKSDEVSEDGDLLSAVEIAEPKIKLGDVIEFGRHTLVCGDSTNHDIIKSLITKNGINTVIYDPPYEMAGAYDYIPDFSKNLLKLVVFWDFKRFAEAAHKSILAGWSPCYEFIWDNVTSWYTPNRPLARHKACGVFGEDDKFDFDSATIVDGKKRTAKKVKNTRGDCDYKPLDGAKHISTVEQFQNTKVEGDHAHAKPIKWISAIYNGIGGSAYLDMFGGSGSTMDYCEQHGKSSTTIEIDQVNCVNILRRYAAISGEESANINGAEVKISDLF